MQSRITKIGLYIAVFTLFCWPWRSVRAIAPDIFGYVRSEAGAGINTVYVRWTDGKGHVRYTLTGDGPLGAGYFFFPSWQDSTAEQRLAWYDELLDVDFDPATAPERRVSMPPDDFTKDGAWGCLDGVHTFTAVVPAGRRGSFSVVTSQLNNSDSLEEKGPIIYTPPAATPTPVATATLVPTPPEFHAVCADIACVSVPGPGIDSCAPAGSFCNNQTWSAWTAVTGSCGTAAEMRTCQCSGPCCSGCPADVDGVGGACNAIQSRGVCTSAPPNTAPAITTISEGDSDGGSIIQTRTVKIDWSFADTGVGCSAAWGYNCTGNTNTFTLKITGGLTQTIAAIAKNQRSWLSGTIFRANTNYAVQVCADNGAGEACSAPVIFTKVAYPAGKISGPIGEYDNATCKQSGANGDIKISTTDTDPAVSVNCSYSQDGAPPLLKTLSYDCAIQLDNVNYDPNPTRNYAVTWQNPGANPQYTTAHCEDSAAACSAAGAACALPNFNFDQNKPLSNTATKLVYLALNPNRGFYKLKNVSYQDHNDVISYFPVNVLPFDADDTDFVSIGSAANPNHFMIGTSAVSYDGVGASLTGSSNIQTFGMAVVSRTGNKNKDNTAYQPVVNFGIDTFQDYLKARKIYQPINAVGELHDGISVKDGDLTLADVPSSGISQAVLVVNGTLTLSGVTINSTKLPFAAIAKKIVIGATVKEMNGLFISDQVELQDSDQPLKINGNLSSLFNAIDTATRHNAKAFQPSIFVNFVPDYYLNLLPYLSTSTFERKELQ